MSYIKKEFNFKEHGAFFAFSREQFDTQKKEGIKYVSFGNGLFLPEETALKIMEDFANHNESERLRRLKEVGLKKIILYELDNYECYYTGDIEDSLETLEWYGATREQVKKLFRNRNAEI